MTAKRAPEHLPILDLALPRPVTSLHQIEIESRCNLRCSYCPSPHLGRPKVSMSEAHYLRALEWARHFIRLGTQRELNLAGIGESTMHPDFVRFVHLAREAVGEDVRLIFATNGILASEEMVKALVSARPAVFVSLHRPEKAGPAVDMYQRYGLLAGVSADPSLNRNDWAGQVAITNSDGPGIPCPWIRGGWVMAMADGRITACCLDASGKGVVGHVDDQPGSFGTKPYELCASCYQHIGVQGYDQFRQSGQFGKSEAT